MRSGRDTLTSIERALQGVKEQEIIIQRELEQSSRKHAELLARRLEALRSLALLHARDALADGVIDEADDLSDQVRAMLQARETTITQLRDRKRKAEASRDVIVDQLDLLNAEIRDFEDSLDEAGAAARTELQNDREFRSIADRRDALADMYQKAKAKADQVAADEIAKGTPYRADPLFMYLWQRGYGSSSYQSSGLIRYLDDWVAGLISFPEARANYAMLTEISTRLKEHAAALEKQVADQSSRVSERIAAKTREIAGNDILVALRSARDRQLQKNRELEEIASELAETGSQLKLYAEGEDPSFQAAVKSYASFLEKQSLVKLMSDAFKTRTEEDDRIVRGLQRLEHEIKEIQNSTASVQQRFDRLVQRKQELTKVSSRFRRYNYDDIGSVFDEDVDLDDFLKRLLRGAITVAEYWAQTRKHQHWRDRPGDPWRQKANLPPFDWVRGGSGPKWPAEKAIEKGKSRRGEFETGGGF